MQSLLRNLLNTEFRMDVQMEVHNAMVNTLTTGVLPEQHTLIQCPRRIGKPFLLATFAVACALSISVEDSWDKKRGLNINIFVASKRESRPMILTMKRFMMKNKYNEKILESNDEMLKIRTFDYKEATIRIFPHNVKSLAGVSADLILIDEVTRVDRVVLTEVIAPVQYWGKCCIIGLTTFIEENEQMVKDLLEHWNFHRVVCKHHETQWKIHGWSTTKPIQPWNSERKKMIINEIMETTQEFQTMDIGGVVSWTEKFGRCGKLEE